MAARQARKDRCPHLSGGATLRLVAQPTWGQPPPAVESSRGRQGFSRSELRSVAPPDSRGRLSPRAHWARRTQLARSRADV